MQWKRKNYLKFHLKVLLDKLKKMKYNLPLIALLFFVAACNMQPKSEVETLTGEFLFYDNAAVLNTGSEIYGVVVDDKLHELHAQALTVQKDSFDIWCKFISKGLYPKTPTKKAGHKLLP